jgi:Concanavalin A-like lectin/glucanases superfamily
MPAPHPRMHGITHVAGGPDPVPGLLPNLGTIDGEILATSPGAYYKLDETSGGWVDSADSHDMTYTARTGTVRGAASGYDEGDGELCVTVAGPDPAASLSPSFIGSVASEFFRFGGVAPMTVSARVRPATVDLGSNSFGVCGTADNPGGTTQGWGLYLLAELYDPNPDPDLRVPGKPCFRRRFGGGAEDNAVGELPLAAGAWVRLTGSFDGATVNLYVDDTLVASDTPATPASLPTGGTAGSTFTVGSVAAAEGSGGTHAPFQGDIDSVIVWDRALTPAEIGGLIETELTVTGGGEGTVLTIGPDGTPIWSKPPAPEVTVNGSSEPAAKTPRPTPPAPPPPDTDPVTVLMIDQPFVYGGSTFTVPPRVWTTIPFTTQLMERMSDKTGVSAWAEIPISDANAGGWLHADAPHTITVPHDMPFLAEAMGQICLRIDNPVVQGATSHRALRIFEITHQKTLLQVDSEQADGAGAEGGMTDVFRGPGITVFASGDTGSTGSHPDIFFLPNFGLAFYPTGYDWLPYIDGVQSLKAGMRLVAQCWHDASVPLTFDCAPGSTYKPHFVVNTEADPAWGPPWSTWL